MQFFPSFAPLAARYNAFILDLWGVIHDGTALYPGVRETLLALKQRNARVVFLSNAPRRTHKVAIVLEQLGITPDLYHGVLSSGEAGYRALASGQLILGERYFYIGPPKDADVLDGLPHAHVDSIPEADYLLNVGFGSEEQSGPHWEEILQEAKQKNLPMLCLNPDLEVVKITGERFACAGVIARDYEKIGGEVVYYGKPYPQVYASVLEMLDAPKDQVLAVGDALHTDILGAKRMGIASVLATGGILQQELGTLDEAQVRAWLQKQDVQPDYVVEEIGR